jgi:hypothetical protein
VPPAPALWQVIHALDEELPCVYYNTWMCHLPETGSFITEVGNDQFLEVLAERYDQEAVQQWKVRLPCEVDSGGRPE